MIEWVYLWAYFDFEVSVFSDEEVYSMALADTGIKKAKPKQRPNIVSDGGGLYLWVTPAGGKLWRWSYWSEGKERLMALGKYPDSLGQARERHSEVRKLLAEGVDPMARRKAAKTAEKAAVENSFQSTTTPWLEHWQDGEGPRHVDYVRRRMEADILPCLGARLIAEIEARELVAMTKAIEQRGARDIAKRALERVGQVFRYSIAH
ncbi:MAG: tyrosine-type recombinase/integrase [Acidobacteriaceae bacterium]